MKFLILFLCFFISSKSIANESVVFVKQHDGLFAISLETTVFLPEENTGPFPVVVILHGTPGAKNARWMPRWRLMNVTREFLQRGYAVVIPMRQGFSKSGGFARSDHCNLKSEAEESAKDVASIVSWLEKQPWANTEQMMLLGQSHGGAIVLAYAQNPHPGFKVFANFAGGLKHLPPTSCNWEKDIIRSFESYGRKTTVETIWFYGENDSLFPIPTVVTPAYEAYTAAGGKAKLVLYGPYLAGSKNAHGMFVESNETGRKIWTPVIFSAAKEKGLPTEIVYPKFINSNE